MVLPIYTFGQPVLRKVAEDITPDYPELKTLIGHPQGRTPASSWGTPEGLDAPQGDERRSARRSDGAHHRQAQEDENQCRIPDDASDVMNSPFWSDVNCSVQDDGTVHSKKLVWHRGALHRSRLLLKYKII